jgi:hypothetical protein
MELRLIYQRFDKKNLCDYSIKNSLHNISHIALAFLGFANGTQICVFMPHGIVSCIYIYSDSFSYFIPMAN